jgi:TRAP-type C4-dicarboxylate transport system permease small subunit
MTTLLIRIDKWLSWLELALAAVAALSIVAMMLITGADVVMRYAFNRPLSWAFDLLTHYLLVASFFLGLSYTLRMNHHICVNFFAQMLSDRSYQAAMAIGCMVGAVIFGVVGWYGVRDAYHAWLNDEVVFGALIWPMWIAKALVPLGMFPLALRSLHRGLSHALLMRDAESQEQLGLRLDQVVEEV